MKGGERKKGENSRGEERGREERGREERMEGRVGQKGMVGGKEREYKVHG